MYVRRKERVEMRSGWERVSLILWVSAVVCEFFGLLYGGVCGVAENVLAITELLPSTNMYVDRENRQKQDTSSLAKTLGVLLHKAKRKKKKTVH